MRNGHRNLWTADEDDHLRELIASNASPTLMSAKLKRSAEAIRMRIIVLRKRDVPPLSSSPRRPASDQQVGSGFEQRFSSQIKI